MSVSRTVSLPAVGAGASDFTTLTSLGGDGWRSPRSFFSVQVLLANDASAGTAIITVNLDPNYLQVINCIGYTKLGAAADVDFSIAIQSPARANYAIAGTLQFNAGGSLNNVAGVWTPPPLPLVSSEGAAPASIVSTTPNVTGDNDVLNVDIFNFWKRAAEETPVEVLLACLPRASSWTGGLE